MRLMTMFLACTVVGGCATYDPVVGTYDPAVALDQCNYRPGCVTSNPTPVSGAPHVRAAAPAGPGPQSQN